MTQLSKLKKQTISYKEWELISLIEFIENLLTKKNIKNHSGTYFKKTSSCPRKLIYLTSFLKYHYAYDDHKNIITLYLFLMDTIKRINLSQCYNLLNYLKDNNILSIDQYSVYDYFELSFNRKNNLVELNTINNHINFLEKIGVFKND